MYKNLPKQYTYPAIIEQAPQNYALYFPDLPGCVSSGETIEQVVQLGKEAAREYLWEMEHDKETPPPPSLAENLKRNPNDAICIIEIPMLPIRARMDHRTVKKTLTIPWYLNELAEARNINFSHTLRDALESKLAL